jgi:tRNA (guanine37-N1)-methyltransferase
MFYAEASEKDAERVRRNLSRLDALDKHNMVQHSDSYVYFPVNISDARIKKLIEKSGVRLVNKAAIAKEPRRTYYDLLDGKLTATELNALTRGFDLFGDIALIDVPPGLNGREAIVARAILQANHRISTVLAKAGPISGVFRTRKMRFISGKRRFIALHRENGCTFRFDVRKVFFSTRFAFERARVTSLVGGRERVMVMFAGAGPFAIEIAKVHKKSRVVAIELNKFGYEYMKGNILLNKTPNVIPVLGDVRDKAKDFKGFADRIIMPMPKSSETFLDEALLVAKKRAVVHIYTFAPTANQFGPIKAAIREHAARNGYKVRFLSGRTVRPYSAVEAEIVLDYEILKGRKPKRA